MERETSTGMIKLDNSDNSNLSVAIIICQSIIAKRACFHNFIAENNPDIVAGCESWLTSSIQSAEVFPNDLKIFRRDRSDGYGGVFIACWETLISEELVHEENIEAVICRIKVKRNKPLVICCVYRPPNNDLLYMEKLCNLLEGTIRNNCDGPIWIAGDINLPNINWDLNSVVSSTFPLSLTKLFLDLLQEYGFTQIVDFPTRGHNILDIHATNRPSLIFSCNPVLGIGDHEAIFTCSSLAVDIQPSCKRKSYSWAKANWSQINEMAKSFCDDFIVNYMVDTNVDVLWSIFKDFCMFCLTCIPSKVIGKSYDHPWIYIPLYQTINQKKTKSI